MTRTPAGHNLRYAEKLPQQALLQKLARYISGLGSIKLLIQSHYFQEQCVIQRTLDEIGEDISFLCVGMSLGFTNHHQRYLAAFWEEEFDHAEAIKSTQRRAMIPRKTIRAYVHRNSGYADVTKADIVGHTLHAAYSGYVHAASPQCMDMCWGDPPRFHIGGLRGAPIGPDQLRDAWNYVYRGYLSITMVAKIFGDEPLVGELYGRIQAFEAASGTSFTIRPPGSSVPPV